MIERSATSAASGRTWRDWVGLVARLVLGGVLLVAGALKVVDIAQFRISIMAYQLVGWDVAGIVAVVLPVLEIALGVLLLVGLFTRASAVVGAGLMVVFIGGIAWAWANGLTIDCGCFGGGGEVDAAATRYPEEIARDVGFAACGLWLTIRPRTPWSLDAKLFPPLDVGEFDDVPQTEEEISR